MRHGIAAPLAALVLITTGAVGDWSDPAAPRIAFNENRDPAGRLSGRTFSIHLEIQQGTWHLLGHDSPPGRVLAFAEAGKAPTIPGPLLRVPLGAQMSVRVTNGSSLTLAVHGLFPRRGVALDSLLLAPGATAEARFTADAEGSFFYWAGEPNVALEDRYFEDSQLYGAFIVDPPGAARPARDRIFVLGIWFDGRRPDGGRDGAGEFLVINGRPWPHTERLDYTLGDTVRWRIINASSDVHPMHLHGFYYRVEAKGDIARDTTYWPAEQRMVVTERLDAGSTMTMAFVPDRPGGWIFHCHLNFHVLANPAMGEHRQSVQERMEHLFGSHAHDDPHNHVETGMGGLMLAFNVRSPHEWQPPDGGRRSIRLFVQSGRLPGDTAQRMSYVVQDGEEPRPDSIHVPGSPLILERGQPTTIWVINRSAEPTQVHWHGLELESPYDGVVGIGGVPGFHPPAIMPGDSFEVRITPPRAGSFMYHTHFSEIAQMTRGLWAPFVVLETGERWDPERDRIFIAGQGMDGATLNGSRGALEPITLASGTQYRFRLMNVTLAAPYLEFWLIRDGSGVPLFWSPLARDGHDLPTWQRTGRRAHQTVGIGETMDFTVSFPEAGSYALEIRSRGGRIGSRQPIVVNSDAAAAGTPAP